MEEIKNITTGAESSSVTENQEVITQEKLYTEAEVDRRITEALKKWEKKTQAKISEAEKLARMSAEEKAQYELSQREKALAEKEKQLAMQENRIEAAKVMAEKGISLAFLDYIVTSDADETMERIKLFQREQAKNVESEVRKRMASCTPKVGGASVEITPDAFRKMSIAQRTELYRSNKELYEKLTKQ